MRRNVQVTFPRPVHWVGSAREDLRDMEEDVQDEIGKALQRVQWGGRPQNSTPLKGFRGANVQEIKVDEDTDTYRCIYTVQFVEAIYVLHVFKKKSHEKHKTPKRDMDLVVLRLRAAEEHHRSMYAAKERGNADGDL